jgi:hypothetical protein
MFLAFQLLIYTDLRYQGSLNCSYTVRGLHFVLKGSYFRPFFAQKKQFGHANEYHAHGILHYFDF